MHLNSYAAEIAPTEWRRPIKFDNRPRTTVGSFFDTFSRIKHSGLLGLLAPYFTGAPASNGPRCHISLSVPTPTGAPAVVIHQGGPLPAFRVQHRFAEAM